MVKKRFRIVISYIIIFIVLFTLLSSIHYNTLSNQVLVFQFGQVVRVQENVGLYFTIPVIQSTKSIFVGEKLYDIPTTTVTTSDKKSMIANCYVTWHITDVRKYYQTLSSESVAQSRLDTSVYAAMKNVISSTTQEDAVNGKDGSLGNSILNKITSLANYGIEVTSIEIKVLDLPNENKDSVYNRMISERNAIAAEYTAKGEKDRTEIKGKTDAQVRTIISNAEAQAADVIAEGEKQYYKILADAYSKSADRTEFYKFLMELDALKESLENGGTIIIDDASPLYDILLRSSFNSVNSPTTTPSNDIPNETAEEQTDE